MTPAEIAQLIADGEALLKRTTTGYQGQKAAWYQNTTTNWYKGLAKLEQARLALLQPPSLVIAPPVGPFTDCPGGGSNEAGIWWRGPSGTTISKRRYHEFTEYGVAVMGYWPPSDAWLFSGPCELADLVVENIGSMPPVMDGRGEACFWIGAPTNARRLVGRNGTWMGMWIGGLSRGSVITDFELLSMPHIGVYVEHAADHIRCSNFRIDSYDNGINCEWWYPDAAYAPFMPVGVPSGMAGPHDLLIENFEITTHGPDAWGIFVDAGVYNVTIRNGKISGANGIAVPQTLAYPTGTINVDVASIDMTGVRGAKLLRHANPMGVAGNFQEATRNPGRPFPGLDHEGVGSSW